MLRGSLTLTVDSSHILNQPSTSGGGGGQTKSPIARRRATEKFYGHKVHLLKPYEWFGHCSCLQTNDINSPYTVITNEYTELLFLSKETFRSILLPHFLSLLESTARFLCHHYSILHSWSPWKLSYLSSILYKVEYGFDETIHTQGSTINCVSFIKSGSIKLTLDGCKINKERIASKICPPTGMLAAILCEEGGAGKKTDVLMGERPGRNRPRGRSKGKPDPRLERERVLRRYRCSPTTLHDTPICVFVPGGMLGALETLCGLKEHLLTAVSSETGTVLYCIDLNHFNHLFKDLHPKSSHQLMLQYLEHVEYWLKRLPSFREVFGLVVTLLRQNLERLERSYRTELAKPNNGRYKPEHLPELALKYCQ